MNEIIKQGEWCNNCEFFESNNYYDEYGGCQSCGCYGSDHLSVKVVEL
jgi:hypothetical protein